jgi:hypothetical protein
MRAGAFVTHFSNQIHYDGARDEEAVIQFTGIGPANYVTPANQGRDNSRFGPQAALKCAAAGATASLAIACGPPAW